MNGSGHNINLLLLIASIPYLFLMFRVYAGLRRIKKRYKKNHEKINVSVVIATNRSAEVMFPLINDIEHQDYDPDLLEVIIVDDSKGLFNHDNLLKASNIKHKIIPNTGSGKKSAMQCGIKAAKAELVITTDDDCRVGTGWISTIASFFCEDHPDMILCPVELDDNKTHFGRMQQLEFLSLQGVTAGSASDSKPVMCNGAGMAFKRSIYPVNGLVKSQQVVSGDDVFLLHHIKKTGASIRWIESADATVFTAPTGNLFQFIKQRARWASKAGFYSDISTLATGISVVLLSLTIIISLALTIVNIAFLAIALYLIIIKSVPDLMIIYNRTKMHHREKLLWYFPIVQLIYPFYVLISLLSGIFRKKKW